jgi:hypothetical protein
MSLERIARFNWTVGITSLDSSARRRMVRLDRWLEIHMDVQRSLVLVCLLACTACQRQPEVTTAARAGTESTTSGVEKPPGMADPSTAGYLCIGPKCNSNVLAARSNEEAHWLIQHGYPSTEGLKRFSGLSDAQLKKEADAGSLAAMVNYGERLVSQGHSASGITYIFDATQRGSIYGYYAMSKVFRTPEVSWGLGGIVESGAYLRVALTLGDSKADGELQRRFPGLSQTEYAAMDRRAASLYETFAKSRPPVPRP